MRFMSLLLFMLLGLGLAVQAEAATQHASCTRASVLAAYTAAAATGDTILIDQSPQDCTVTNKWTTTLDLFKEITVQGLGPNSTRIGLGASTTPPFRIRTHNSRITQIEFHGGNTGSPGTGFNTTNYGMITVGINTTAACTGSVAVRDYRIDHNRFTNLYYPANDGCLGCNAIATRGDVYGLIDHNEFVNCAGECLDIEGAGYFSHTYSDAPGQYVANHTNYIEDNTFTLTQTYDGENLVDGNSGGRYVFRYNDITINSPGGTCGSCRGIAINGIISNHDCSGGDVCNDATQADMANPLVEAYNNTVHITGTNAASFMNWRGMAVYIHDNTIIGTTGLYNALVEAYHLRSGHRSGCPSLTFRGFSDLCHEGAGAEGVVLNKTTLNGALANSTACPIMTSVSGITAPGSIRVDNEQIDFTGVSGTTLTPCMRGAGFGTGARASHLTGASVNLFVFGVCGDQQTQSYMWNNVWKTTDLATGTAFNSVTVHDDDNFPEYQPYDIQSFAQRPSNWQYRNDGTAFTYSFNTPHPHPLQGGSAPDTIGPAAPTNLRITDAENAFYQHVRWHEGAR